LRKLIYGIREIELLDFETIIGVKEKENNSLFDYLKTFNGYEDPWKEKSQDSEEINGDNTKNILSLVEKINLLEQKIKRLEKLHEIINN
jgi:hypothetical protein